MCGQEKGRRRGPVGGGGRAGAYCEVDARQIASQARISLPGAAVPDDQVSQPQATFHRVSPGSPETEQKTSPITRRSSHIRFWQWILSPCGNKAPAPSGRSAQLKTRKKPQAAKTDEGNKLPAQTPPPPHPHPPPPPPSPVACRIAPAGP